MRNTRKQITLFILLLAVLLAFVGCSGIIVGSTPADTTPADTTPSGTEKSGEFVVTGEKYAYKNKDVLLLNVENQTDKNYDVTAVVHYFDAEGNEIKSQKQTFAGWASGYQNYFLFQPDTTFEIFTCDLELKEAEGKECNAQYMSAVFYRLKESKRTVYELYSKGDYTKYPTIAASFKVENKSENALHMAGLYVVFNNEGDIYIISSMPQATISKGERYQDVKLYYDLTPEDFAWPSELIGDVGGVFVITRVWE